MPSTRCSPSASRRTPSCRRSSSRHRAWRAAAGWRRRCPRCGRSARASRSGPRTAPARARATNASSPLARAAGRGGRAASAPKRVRRVERGRAASWPTRRRPSRRRACEQVGVQPQGRRRQRQHASRLGRQEAAGTEPGPGPGGGEPAGHGQAAGQAQPFQAPVEIGHQRALAAEQMAAAGEVDGEPVRAVDHDPRAVAAAPEAQRGRAPSASASGSAVAHEQLRADRPRVGQRQPRLGPECSCRGADGGQPRHAPVRVRPAPGACLGRRERPAGAARLQPHAARAAIRAARAKDSACSCHSPRRKMFLFCSNKGQASCQGCGCARSLREFHRCSRTKLTKPAPKQVSR